MEYNAGAKKEKKASINRWVIFKISEKKLKYKKGVSKF